MKTVIRCITIVGKCKASPSLEDQAERLAKENSCPFVDNELPYGRAESGHPVIVNYFYHEEVRGSENSGRRNPKK